MFLGYKPSFSLALEYKRERSILLMTPHKNNKSFCGDPEYYLLHVLTTTRI